MADVVEIKRENLEHKGRFALYENGQYAGEMTYSSAGTDLLIIDHTAVEEGCNGKGFGRKLLMKVVEYARENDRKIVPLCPYAKSVFDKTPEIRDVLHV